MRHAGGTLIVVPNLLGVIPPETVLPARTIETARAIRHWIVETPKAARAFLRAIDIQCAIAELAIAPIPASTDTAVLDAALTPLREGHDVGVLSDAGCPGVADPGAAIVTRAHATGMRVVPLVGPSAVLLALMASGLNGQRFAFHGYLPVKPDARAHAIVALERRSRAERRTEIFIETPYRNTAMLASLARTLQNGTRVCVAADLTLATETIECATAAQWRTREVARFERRPAIFLLEA